MFGELIIVDDLDIPKFISHSSSHEHMESAVWRRLNEIHFSSLWSILEDIEYSENLENRIQVFTSDAGRVWLIVFPDELRNSIAKRFGQNNDQIISRWSEAEEFSWGWTSSDISRLFADLVRLSRKAIEEEKKLVYWGRL